MMSILLNWLYMIMKMNDATKNIYLVGEGWGFVSAQIGLNKVFKNVVSMSSLDVSIRNGIIIFDGYKPIVPHDVVVGNTCINVHYSLLPRYRGLHSTVWAILNDEDYLGLSVHIMTDDVDDGPILHQFMVENDRVQTSREYMELFNDYIGRKLGVIINDYISGQSVLIPNDKKDATWVGKRSHQDCKIDFSRDLNYQRCFFRALVAPYPLPFVEYKGEELIVNKVSYHPVNVDTHIGRILNIDNDGLWVKVKDGYLVIKEIMKRDSTIVPLNTFRIGQYFNR